MITTDKHKVLQILVNRIDFGAAPIVTYAVSANLPSSQLRQMLKDKLEPALSQVDGVAQVRIVGAQPAEGSRIPGIRKWPEAYLPKIYDPKAVDDDLGVMKTGKEAEVSLLRRSLVGTDDAAPRTLMPGFGPDVDALGAEVRMRRTLQTDVFVWHGYTDLWIEGRWVKATPAFNLSLCERFGGGPVGLSTLVNGGTAILAAAGGTVLRTAVGDAQGPALAAAMEER